MKLNIFCCVVNYFFSVCLYYTIGIPIHPNAYEHLIAPKISEYEYKNYQKSTKQKNTNFQKIQSSSR